MAKATSPFALLKKNKTNLDKLVTALANESQTASFEDPTEFKYTPDKNGNAYVLLRFLPEPANETLPWVKLYSHGFKGPSGRWLIEECPTTIGRDCPICQANAELWNAPGGDDSPEKKIVRGSTGNPGRKRKLAYRSNVLIISNKAQPETEGNVYIFRYGLRIWEKIQGVMSPVSDEIPAINPFDFWTGANFKLVVKKSDGQTTYSDCSFADPSPLFDGDDAKLEEVYGKLHSLEAYIQPDQFKSDEDLRKHFNRVIGASVPTPPAEEVDVLQPAAPSKVKAAPEAPVAPDTEDSEMDFFQALADGEDDD